MTLDLLVAEGLMTVADASSFLGIKRAKLYLLMDEGRLPYAKIGRARRIPKRAVVALAVESMVVRAPVI